MESSGVLNSPVEMYDIEADPFEMNNLIDLPEFAEVLQDMRQRLR